MSTNAAELDDWLAVGVVTKVHGVRGRVVVRPFYAESSAFAEGVPLRLRQSDGTTVSVDPGHLRQKPSTWLITVEGVSNRETAEAWVGAELERPRSSVSCTDGEYLYADLVGCEVEQAGRSLGTVTGLFNAGASDILVVRNAQEERLVPFVDEWIDHVDVLARKIRLSAEGEWEAAPIADGEGQR